jgi:hypothetical protein
MKRWYLGAALGSLCLAFGAINASATPTAVDLELVLAVDISGSINDAEYNLQKTGYVNAFNNLSLWNAIEAGALDKIAVTYVEWSGAAQQYQLVDWTLIDSYASSQTFASAIGATTRAGGEAYNLTAPGSAINYSAGLFIDNGYDGTRNVIDVSGDGSRNDGAITATARDAAFSNGISINGLVIEGSEAGLFNWYVNNVQIGPNSFVIAASGFDTFGTAVSDKLEREIINPPNVIPEPTTMLLFGTGLAGLVAVGRKRSKKIK